MGNRKEANKNNAILISVWNSFFNLEHRTLRCNSNKKNP